MPPAHADTADLGVIMGSVIQGPASCCTQQAITKGGGADAAPDTQVPTNTSSVMGGGAVDPSVAAALTQLAQQLTLVAERLSVIAAQINGGGPPVTGNPPVQPPVTPVPTTPQALVAANRGSVMLEIERLDGQQRMIEQRVASGEISQTHAAVSIAQTSMERAAAERLVSLFDLFDQVDESLPEGDMNVARPAVGVEAPVAEMAREGEASSQALIAAQLAMMTSKLVQGHGVSDADVNTILDGMRAAFAAAGDAADSAA